MVPFLRRLSSKRENKSICPDCRQAKYEFQLPTAAGRGHLRCVQKMIHNGVDVNSPDGHQKTALHKAVSRRRPEIINFLLEKKANPSARDRHKLTPLHWAAYRGYLNGIKILLKAKADISAADKNQRHAIHLTASRGYIDCLSVLLEARAGLESQAHNKKTPLHCAAKHGHVKVVELLVGKGAKVNCTNKDNNTALHTAAYRGHLGAVRSLVETRSPLQIREAKQLTEMLQDIWPRIPTFLAKLITQFVVPLGADPNARNFEGKLALDRAVDRGRVETAKYLRTVSGPIERLKNKSKDCASHLRHLLHGLTSQLPYFVGPQPDEALPLLIPMGSADRLFFTVFQRAGVTTSTRSTSLARRHSSA